MGSAKGRGFREIRQLLPTCSRRNEKNPSLTLLWGLGFGLALPELALQVSWKRLCPLGHFWVTPICASCAVYQDRLFVFFVPCSLQAFPSAAVSSPVEESETGFTGRRLNSKMQVYSGSKTAYLPKMMSLYQQCIRVLSNNIDCEYLSLSETLCTLKFWQLVYTGTQKFPLGTNTGQIPLEVQVLQGSAPTMLSSSAKAPEIVANRACTDIS